MRLTHKVEYKDKRKNREPMIKIRNKLFEIENLFEEFNINDTNELRTCLENERKGTEYFENWWNKRFEELLKSKVEALKIIKKKKLMLVVKILIFGACRVGIQSQFSRKSEVF